MMSREKIIKTLRNMGFTVEDHICELCHGLSPIHRHEGCTRCMIDVIQIRGDFITVNNGLEIITVQDLIEEIKK